MGGASVERRADEALLKKRQLSQSKEQALDAATLCRKWSTEKGANCVSFHTPLRSKWEPIAANTPADGMRASGGVLWWAESDDDRRAPAPAAVRIAARAPQNTWSVAA